MQRIRAEAFRASKEVADATTEGDPNARQEFDEVIAMAEEDFEAWSDLAGTDEERRQVQQVRDSYDTLVRDAEEVFTLIEDGSEEEASALLEGRLEDEGVRSFDWPPRKR